ncbi:MAG: EVE domain-containing protein [Alphaproteobacteria bacterium]|nr:MAG: EVE domain-containing protein [Alphaproteobacteria bacterium]
MAHWLLKSEPGDWSWADQVENQVCEWDGVRNAQALGHMKEMALGDTAFFYHSGEERRIMGIVEVVRGWREDPDDPKSGLVDVRAIEHLPRPVTLAEIKADPAFAESPLVRQPRLSVMPVPDELWQKICEMGGL